MKNYDPDGVRLTDCCAAFSTYHGSMLCCKACFNEVSNGEGDGTEWAPTVLVARRLGLVHKPEAFTNKATAFAFARQSKLFTEVMVGAEGKYWNVCRVDAEKLEAAGYTYATKP